MIEERKRILKLVEEGNLSANEALTLLEALEDQKKGTTNEPEQMAHELSTMVDYEEQQQTQDEYKTHYYKQSSVKSKLTDFLDSAVKKIKDLDLDFNFGPGIEMNHIFQHSDVSVRNLELDVANGSIELIPWSENDVRVECTAKVYKVETVESAREAFLQECLFSIEGNKLKFSVQKKQMKVNAKIYVPSVQFEQVKMRMFNGPISGENLQVASLKAKSANGSITFGKLSATDMELETANGHINLKDSQSQACEVETINGTIRVDGEYEKLDIQSFNGNIICELPGEKCHTLEVKTTAGNIDILTSTARDIEGELKSNLGGFDCAIPNMNIVKEKNEVVQKYLRFKTNQGKEKKLHVFAETKTGSVHIKPL
ncbi:DUF4097 family beta strand repeat-containing protein [Bacillus sp. PS06]|uniref:DUF4097 family beta strand repeat-containing protein n=1 Tax=Bacillus sp. PS06 TaxID=2764176 RepID=UPI001786269B|nr:DUF4097 domain-containing protein [Bacillus sp. PS06]MBD8071476.1 DUF4097 domain-containing protein [Bacillus sp. PS06]